MKRSELDIIGGPTEVAKLCGVKPSTVSMWFVNKGEKLVHGHIPYKHAKVILLQFAKMGKEMSIEYIIGE